jgi:uncharacterized membrane protein required for colicin V production
VDMPSQNYTSLAMNAFSINWVDLTVVGFLFVGILRGRKRGMSEELLDLIKWTLIVIIGAFFYQPGGSFLAQNSMFSPLTCYLSVYSFIVLFLMLIFSFIRRSVGEKLVGSDTFGSAEYYLGMTGGLLRYACIVIVGMALLNARHYDPEEIAASAQYQQDNFGSSFFMTLPDLQREVFISSVIGHLAYNHLQPVFIKPTPARASNVVAARQRDGFLSEVLDKKLDKTR